MTSKKPILSILFGIIIILASLVAAFLIYQKKNQSFTGNIKLDPLFALRDLYNNPVTPPKTEFIILNFWASWCPPCVQETPSLVRFTEKYSDFFTLYALSQDTTKKEIEDFIKTFPSFKSKHITLIHDDSQSMARAFKIEKLPETFIYSRTEKKFFQISGATDWENPEILIELKKQFKLAAQLQPKK